jgi:glycosyltransferase involved in cell wall biosynthesis
MRRRATRALDLLLAGATVLGGACALLARRPRRRRSAVAAPPRLLALGSMHSLSLLRARQAEHTLTHRNLDGYFEHVWSVHPLVGAHPGEPPAAGVGAPTYTALTPSHTMIEGKTRRLPGLERLPYLNFALAQVDLVRELDRIVTDEGVGIVRGDPYYCGLLALLLGRLSHRAVELRIIADHDAIYEAVGSLAYPRLFRHRAVEQRVIGFTLARADLVVIGTPVYREFALRNGAPPERMACVGNFAMISPIHAAEPGERQPLEDEFGLGDRPVVVCVGRLERMKHPQDVIRSVAEARRRHPRLAAVMVGDGAMRAELERLCAELGVEDDVFFAGERDQAWIARLLVRAAVVAAPIAGLALVESALSGTPIVAYDVEWHSELIRPGVDGILVADRDTEAMAEAICALVADGARAARLGAAARGRALALMEPAKLLAHERALAGQLLGLASARSA